MQAIFEDLPVGSRQSIHAFHYVADSFTTPWHFHPQHELTLIEESSGTKFIGDHVGAYSPGELVLLRGNLPHCWKNESATGRSRSTVIQWNPDTFSPVPELDGVFRLTRKAARGILFSVSDTAAVRDSIRELPELPAVEKYLRLLGILHQLVSSQWEYLSAADFRDQLPAADGNRMQRIHRYVAAYYPGKILLKDVAGEIHLSEQAFHRFFRKMMGRPFTRFLTEYRVNRASQLLVETDWPVSRIALACGFASLPYFHRQFKRLMSFTPLGYRKRHVGR